MNSQAADVTGKITCVWKNDGKRCADAFVYAEPEEPEASRAVQWVRGWLTALRVQTPKARRRVDVSDCEKTLRQENSSKERLNPEPEDGNASQRVLDFLREREEHLVRQVAGRIQAF